MRYRGGLCDTAGNAAHAATFIRERVIVLDTDLRRDAGERRRILLHEVFHFTWVRLGNRGRLEWEDVLRREIAAGASGEAGWSAEWRKRELKTRDIETRTRRWREYCCESFCDSAAWFFGGGIAEVTLRDQWRKRRAAWFQTQLGGREIPI